MRHAPRAASGDDSSTDGEDDDANSSSNDDYPSCSMGVIALIGDGNCNAINNVLVCGEL